MPSPNVKYGIIEQRQLNRLEGGNVGLRKQQFSRPLPSSVAFSVTAFICTTSVNMPRCLPIETSAACLSCSRTRTSPLGPCEIWAIAAAMSGSISSLGTMLTRGRSTRVTLPCAPVAS
jgi:hypothetical protein